MSTQLSKEMIDAFLFHPEWKLMELYIQEHFANSTLIESIDISNSSTTVHAEVIARQKIDQDIKGLIKSFDVAKAQHKKKKQTYE